MPRGSSHKNAGLCVICSKDDIGERFLKLTSNVLPKAMQSQAVSKLKPFNKKVDISKLDAIVQACDESLVSRNSYYRLAAMEPQLIHEHHVAIQRIEITDLINKMIKIGTFSIDNNLNSQPCIQGEGIVFDYKIGNDAYRSIRSILTVLFSIWKRSSPLTLIPGDIIKLKLRGDGHNVG
ncbi:7008_t:CDS:2 [Cetraspora pellucida]|uniref:7008_t:CDS:1 n=1 Tax=Cetraspora pellucida TaxID=1433469 RepID=A0A9N9NGM2_9GLOM|nr:7008_t:CDS:2 [Cetraspora pellucida]